MLSKPDTPITEFTLAWDRLLNDPITTRDALTTDELDFLKLCVERLTERFFNQRNLGEPDVGPPVMLPHGAGSTVE